VGLGNIGAEYAETRHNIGFKVLDTLAEVSNTSFSTSRYGDTATIKHRGRELLLLKPSTYMNLSGKAVRYWMQTEKIPVERVFVVVDDIAIPFGAVRIRAKGSDGGHNGLKSIIEHLSSQEFPRIRIGVGEKPNKDYDLAAWVTGQIPEADREPIYKILEASCEACTYLLNGKLDEAMGKFNGLKF
jgi:PTH1 family peptidyl-tRNA hydrolase